MSYIDKHKEDITTKTNGQISNFEVKEEFSKNKKNSDILSVLRHEAWNFQKALATLNFLWIIAQRKEVWVGFTITQLLPATSSSKTISELIKNTNPTTIQGAVVKSNSWFCLAPYIEKEIRKQNGGIPIDGVLVNLFAYAFKFVRPWLFPKKEVTAFFVQKLSGSPINGKGMHGMIYNFCKDFDKRLNFTPSLFRTQQATIISQEKIGEKELGMVEKQQAITARIMNHTLEVHNKVYDKFSNQEENTQATKNFQHFFTSPNASTTIQKIGQTMSDVPGVEVKINYFLLSYLFSRKCKLKHQQKTERKFMRNLLKSRKEKFRKLWMLTWMKD